MSVPPTDTMAELPTPLMERYQLKDEDCNKQVSDKHLEELSRTHCLKWSRLPAYLGMDTTMVEDIERKRVDEDEKRHIFFKKWKEKNGSAATYKTLIAALMNVDCREDAEYVCELLQSRKNMTSEPFSVEAHTQKLSPTNEPAFTESVTAASDPKKFTNTPNFSRDLERAQNPNAKAG